MNVADRVFDNLVSPFDIRDYKIATTEREFPEAFSLPEVSVKNQGSVGSCVAHACSSVVEFHNKRQEGTDTVFSTEFIYGYRPAGYYVGEGMYIRNALKTLRELGDCPVSDLRGNHACPEAMEVVEAHLDELKDKDLITFDGSKVALSESEKEINTVNSRKDVEELELNMKEKESYKLIQELVDDKNLISKYTLEGHLLYGDLKLTNFRMYHIILSLQNKGLLKSIQKEDGEYYLLVE